ncbi:clotting factor B-like isoform X1, partial [Dinothrombium tinctorium]
EGRLMIIVILQLLFAFSILIFNCSLDLTRNPKEYTIRVGALKINHGQLYRVADIIVHDFYQRPDIYHDIALLVIDGEIKFSEMVKPVCLPNKKHTNFYLMHNDQALVAGFGSIFPGGPSSEKLLEAMLPIVRREQCNVTYSRLFSMRLPHGITAACICAGGVDGKDACQGDSGGPLIVIMENHPLLIGVVSFGYKCGVPGFPGVFTNVVHYSRWIREVDRRKQLRIAAVTNNAYKS